MDLQEHMQRHCPHENTQIFDEDGRLTCLDCGKKMASPIMKYFEYTHLPEKLQEVSKPICQLAGLMDTMPDSAEKSAGLRKLLEAKDCFVRAALEVPR